MGLTLLSFFVSLLPPLPPPASPAATPASPPVSFPLIALLPCPSLFLISLLFLLISYSSSSLLLLSFLPSCRFQAQSEEERGEWLDSITAAIMEGLNNQIVTPQIKTTSQVSRRGRKERGGERDRKGRGGGGGGERSRQGGREMKKE